MFNFEGSEETWSLTKDSLTECELLGENEARKRYRAANGMLREYYQTRWLKAQPWGCSSAGRAPALQAGGQEFDPPHLHQRDKERRTKN